MNDGKVCDGMCATGCSVAYAGCQLFLTVPMLESWNAHRGMLIMVAGSCSCMPAGSPLKRQFTLQ
jgi:hypothetical protein